MAMKLEYVKVAKYAKYDRKPTVCPHNDACRCENQDCYNCGWNPKVAKMRIEKLKKGMQGG